MRRSYLSVPVLLFVLQGCMAELKDDMAGDMEIEIKAKVSSSVLVSKADGGEIDYDTDVELPVTLIRCDEGGISVPSECGEIGAVMARPSQDGLWTREIDFSTPQFYKDKSSVVGFAGWYPSSTSEGNGWVKDENGNTIHSGNTMTYELDGLTDVMVSDFVTGDFNTKIPPMKFSHALCMFKVYAYAIDEDTKDEWGKLTGITIQNLPQRLFVNLPDNVWTSGDVSFSFSPREETFSYDMMEPGAEKELHAGSVTEDERCYIGTVLGGVPAIGVLGISATTEYQTSGNSVSIARNFKPGYAYNIYLRFSSKGIINAEVSSSDWEYEGDKDYVINEDFDLLTDLSRYGTANSYVVSSANRGYCFDATVKGNGVNTLTKRDGTVIQLPDKVTQISPAYVRVLRSDAMMKLQNGSWVMITDPDERRNTEMLTLVSEKLSNGKVIFKVPGNASDLMDFRLQYKGNVKIGAFDAAGNIIWSWHIWITDDPVNQGYSNGYIAMDRNLGAITTDYSSYEDAKSHWSGLYYQFGRKDPIFRATVDDSLVEDGWVTDKQDSPVSVAEAHSRPTTYFYNRSGNNWTTDTEYSANFWGYTSIRDDIVKTLYDPCPPGYQVPGNSMWEESSSGMTSEKVYNTSDGNFAGYRFTIGGMIQIYYPTTVCVADGQISSSDEVGVSAGDNDFVFLGSATPYESFGTGPDYNGVSYHFRYNEDRLGTDYSSVLVYDPEVYHTQRSDAYPVRCVVENSSPIVKDLSEVQTANSYVVSRTGFYQFRTDVRGNGVTGLHIMDSQNNTTFFRSFDAGLGAGITNVDRVDLLWWQGDLRDGSRYRSWSSASHTSQEIESECPVTILDNGSVVDGYAMMYVRVNENTYGNVGIAAYDSNNNIVWSWHIWIQPGINVVDLGDYTVMDRNIGATYSPDGTTFSEKDRYASYGLYYQWGRKDPFFPPDAGNTSTYYWYKKAAGGGWERKTGNDMGWKGTIDSSVKNPNQYFRSDNTFWQTTYTDNKGAANDFWGYVGSAGVTGNSFAKTMYDPCPPGYRVMRHDVFESANICQSNDSGEYFIRVSGGGYFWNPYGVYFEDGMSAMGQISAGMVWFPNSGMINNSGVFDRVGEAARISTATPCYTSGSPLKTREMRIYKNNSYSYKVKEDHTDNWQVDGRVVRCQME